MQEAGHCAAAENRSEPMVEPGKVEAETGEGGEEEKQGDGPVQNARVDGMPRQFAGIDFGAADGFKALPGFVVEAINCCGRRWLRLLLG